MRKSRFETPGEVRLHIDNPSGSVSITTHDEAVTEVEVSSDRPGEAEELIDEARIESLPSGSGFDVFVEIPRRQRGGGLSSLLRLLDMTHGITITVRAPRQSSAEVTTASASIDADGPLSGLTAKTASGSVRAGEVSGDVRVRTASGSVAAAAVGGQATIETASGKVKLESVSGKASLRTASGRIALGDAGGELEARTVSGSIEVSNAGAETRLSSVSGSLRVGCCRSGEVSLRTVSGSIVVGIAQGSALHVDAHAVSGSLESEIELHPERDEGPEPEQSIDLEVRSVSGSVRVVRAGASAAA